MHREQVGNERVTRVWREMVRDLGERRTFDGFCGVDIRRTGRGRCIRSCDLHRIHCWCGLQRRSGDIGMIAGTDQEQGDPRAVHDPYMVASAATSPELERAARLLRDARRIVVLTGAGVSAESGVPTFRA